MFDLENGEQTVLISKQDFADKAAETAARIISVYGPLILPVMAKFCAELTEKLFGEGVEE